ncbi:MAG: hypothetical protein WBL61_12045 [Bryobacteraceae bacterium]
MDDLIQLEIMLNRFRKLVAELMRGSVTRNSFQAWEVEILIDYHNSAVAPRHRLETLRQYQREVEKQMETGPGPPMKFSEFLQQKTMRRPSTR